MLLLIVILVFLELIVMLTKHVTVDLASVFRRIKAEGASMLRYTIQITYGCDVARIVHLAQMSRPEVVEQQHLLRVRHATLVAVEDFDDMHDCHVPIKMWSLLKCYRTEPADKCALIRIVSPEDDLLDLRSFQLVVHNLLDSAR